MEEQKQLSGFDRWRAAYLPSNEPKRLFLALAAGVGMACGRIVQHFRGSNLAPLFGMIGGLVAAFFIGAVLRIGEEDELR